MSEMKPSHEINYGLHELRYQDLRRRRDAGWDGSQAEASLVAMRDTVRQGVLEYVPEARSLLELGCGDGSMAMVYRDIVSRVSGIDISPTAIAWAKERSAGNPGFDFVTGNVLSLPFAEGEFDVVVDGHCAHCIVGEDRARFFSEAFRVLRPGGLFVVMTMCNEPRGEGERAKYDASSRCLVHGKFATRYFASEDELKREVRQAGFILRRFAVAYDDVQDGFECFAVKP